MTVKNFWSLNVDEVLVADKLQSVLKGGEYQVFFPLKAQLKDIDLVLYNMKKRVGTSVQVKGSRTYEPQKREVERFGDGQAGWIKMSRKSIFETQNPVDYYIFLIHLLTRVKNKLGLEPEFNN